MKFFRKKQPREFKVGNKIKFSMYDCGKVHLGEDEQVTFITDDGNEYDVAKKNWGFYATPSMNGRLESFNLRTVLIRNKNTNRFFLFLVEKGKEDKFYNYLDLEDLEIIILMDNTDQLEKLKNKLNQMNSKKVTCPSCHNISTLHFNILNRLNLKQNLI